MDNLVNKFRNLKILKEERSRLLKEERQAKNKKILKKLLSKGNPAISELLELKDLDSDDLEKVRVFMRIKLEENLRLRHNENARQCLEALVGLKEDKKTLEAILKKSIEEIIQNTTKIKISLRISILESMRSVDILGLHEYFDSLEDSLVKEFVEKVDLSPKGLDKFLNEITNLKPTSFVRENYSKFEKIYFEKVMSIIKEDEKNILEDIVYVVHKIKRRNNLVGVDMMGEIKSYIMKNGILKTEDEVGFFQSMF